MQKKIIPIVYATNNDYAPYASVSITSLVKNSSKEFFYEITVFHTDLSEENIELFSLMSGENYRVKPLCVTRFIEKELKLMYTNFHFSKEMFYRILIPSILSEHEKVIYLDCDTVVLGDISELYKTELEGNVIAAANDIMHANAKGYVINSLKIDTSKYVNSGVLVIDCNKFKEQNIKERFFEELAVRTSLKYPDQDLINIVCGGNIKYLSHKWNHIWHYHVIKSDPTLNLSDEEMLQYNEDAKDIGILHFTSAVKPWNNKILELSRHFWDYVPESPFQNKIIKAYKNVPMKHYIGYHFIDEYDDKVVITASLYALDEIKYDDVVLTIDGVEAEHEFYYSHIIEIDRRVYNRTFFTITIPKDSITHKKKITFYERDTGKIFRTIFSATFPLDISLRSYVALNDVVFYNFQGSVFFAPPTKEVLIEKENAFKNDLEIRKNNESFKKSNKLRKLYGILKHFFKKDVWLVSDRIDSAGDNGQAFFEYLQKNKPKNVKVYFVLDKKSKDYKKIKRIGKVVQPYSKKLKLLYLFCTRNISAHLEKGVLHPIFNYTQLKDILNKCKNVFLQHGIIKDDLSLVYNRTLFDLDIFVTSTRAEYNSIAFNPAYGCGERVTKLTGLPRYDKLVDKKEKLIVFLPTWRKYYFVKDGEKLPVSDEKNMLYFEFYDTLLHDERLLSFAKENGYKLCYYPHELMREFKDKIAPLDKDVFVDAKKFTYNDIFSKAALLFTDFSSCQFDFAYLRKPVVYSHFDKEKFFSTHTYRKGYFEYERDGFGEVVYNVQDSVDLLINYMQNGCELKDEYRDRIDNFFEYNDNKNCERLMQEILNLG